jgi:sortase A
MPIRNPLRNQPTTVRLAAFFLTAVALAGVALIADGLYIKAKAELSQVLLRRSFAEKLEGVSDGRPWPWADFSVAAKISAPRLHQSDIVLAGATGQTLAFGPAWLENTAVPGNEGTSVIAAHRDTHFSWLKDVRAGDIVTVELANGKTYAFRAGQGRVARWDDNGINVAASGHHLALATCWPFDGAPGGPLRYIVETSLIDEPQPVLAAAHQLTAE